MQSYNDFIERKTQLGSQDGFSPVWMPGFLFDFQQAIVEWAVIKGRCAVFADCGTGKTPMQLVWAENVVRKTGKPVLIVTPLAVSLQTVREAEKFGIGCYRSADGTMPKGSTIVVANYERLHFFDPKDFAGCVCDESSILKSFDGVRRNEITSFMRKLPYRLLCTATAAPNDTTELGTSSEALGFLGHIDMLNRFFRNDQNTSAMNRFHGHGPQWRFKGHAEDAFWRWVVSWARSLRKPSDMGFDDGKFILPDLIESEHVIKPRTLANGMLFEMPAIGLQEEREERKRTIQERCEKAASLVVGTGHPAIVWCDLNPEGDLLENLIPDCVQVSGKDSDEAKEEKFMSFISGTSRVLVTKKKIGAWGLNFQHCAHEVYFPDHSFEQYYQAVRRCWRFGQTHPVIVDVVLTKGQQSVMENLRRKAQSADRMFTRLVDCMNEQLHIDRTTVFTKQEACPSWL